MPGIIWQRYKHGKGAEMSADGDKNHPKANTNVCNGQNRNGIVHYLSFSEAE